MPRAPDNALPDRLLGVQAGAHYWLIEAEAVTLTEVPPLSPVPLARPWFRGLVATSGGVVGVIDLSAFLGGALTPLTHDSRLMRPKRQSLTAPGTDLCFLLGPVMGERVANELTLVRDTPAPSHEPPWAGPRVRDGRGRLWQLLNLPALLSQPDCQDILP